MNSSFFSLAIETECFYVLTILDCPFRVESADWRANGPGNVR